MNLEGENGERRNVGEGTNGATDDGAAAGREDAASRRRAGIVAGGRAAPAGVPDPELVEQAKRRRFTAEYKLRIWREAEACTAPGEVGELLRREGLYTSHLDVLAQAAQGRCAGGARAAARAQAGRSARRGDRRAVQARLSVPRPSWRRRAG